jgi:hypothetical protein
MGNKLRDEDLNLNIIVNGDKAKKELGDLEKESRDLTNRNKELRIEKEKLIRANKQETEEFKQVTRQMADNNKALKENTDRQTKLRKEIGLTGLTMRQLRDEQTRLKRLMDSTTPNTPQWKAYNAQLSAVNTQMRTVGTGMGNMRGAASSLANTAKSLLPAFGFAAIAAAAGIAFAKIIASTDTLSTRWAVFIGGMRTATDEFFRTLATGNWSNFLDNMREAVRVGREYEIMLDKIEAKQRALTIIEAEYREEIVRLEEDLRNKGLTNQQRLEAGNRRIAIEEELAVKRAKVANDIYKNELSVAVLSSKLREDELMQLARDFDSEKKLKAEKLLELQAELKKEEAKQGKKGAATGVLYPGMQTTLADSSRINDLKQQISTFSPLVQNYAQALSQLGNSTDEQLNKVAAAFAGLKDAEVSGRESIKRVITMVNSLKAGEGKGKGTGAVTAAATTGPDFAAMLAPAAEDPISNFAIQQAEDEAQRLAEKKASEEEWTAFLKAQIDERVAAEQKELEYEAEIESARVELKQATMNAIGELAGMLSTMAKEGSAAQIAMLAVEKAAAIASIIINTLAANAKAKATLGPVAGTIWSITNGITAAASIAKIVGTTITDFKDKKNNDKPGYATGKYPGLQTGMYGDEPHYALFNEVPGQPEMVVDGLTTRRIQFNYPEIMRAILAVRDGRYQQHADGKYPSPSPMPSPSSAGGGSYADPILAKLDQLNRNIANLKIYTAIEDIKKGDKKYTEIQNTRGL